MSKHDNAAVEVDPYAAYYEQYASQVAESQEVPFTQYVSEKQGFAGTMENALGPDAAVSKHFYLISMYSSATYKGKAVYHSLFLFAARSWDYWGPNGNSCRNWSRGRW